MPFSDADIRQVSAQDQDLETARRAAFRLAVFYKVLVAAEMPSDLVYQLTRIAASEGEFGGCGCEEGSLD